MRRKLTILTITVLVLATILLAACNQNSPAKTPDPCSQAEINNSLKPVLESIHAFDDTTFAGNITPQQSLIIPILDMQKTRRSFESLVVPSCLETLHKDGIDYMNSVIQYMGLFMAGSDQNTVTSAINASQNLRIVYEQEKARLLGQTFFIPPTRTPGPTATVGAPTTEPTTTSSGSALVATGVTITNNSVESVNLRSAPMVTGSDIVDLFAAGATADVLAKNDVGDWLLISYNSKQVWVFGALVTINGDLAAVPVYGSTPTQ